MDWYDGLIARKMPNRSESRKLFGAHMDSLADMVTSATGPAILLLSVGNFSPWFYPGALAIIMSGVLRLAYFDVYGLDENGALAGVTHRQHTDRYFGGVFVVQLHRQQCIWCHSLRCNLGHGVFARCAVSNEEVGRSVVLHRHSVRRYPDRSPCL